MVINSKKELKKVEEKRRRKREEIDEFDVERLEKVKRIERLKLWRGKIIRLDDGKNKKINDFFGRN